MGITEISPGDEKLVSDMVKKIALFSSGESDECIHCEKKIDYLSKHGRSVYAYPCQCRIWQGNIPDKWMPHLRKKNCFVFTGKDQ